MKTPLQLLNDPQLDEILPEVAALRGVQQPPQYHQEGDAFIHTRLALEALPPDADERVQWAVLLHDIGKAKTTRFIDGRWRAWGHDSVGARMVPAIMERLGLQHISDHVAWLVRHHHFALSWGLGSSRPLSRKQRRFCNQPLFPLLIQVARADAAGSHSISDKGDLIGHIERQLT